MKDLKSVLGDWSKFLDKIFSNLKSVHINLSELKELDHLAYRVDSYPKYESLKNKLSHFGALVSESTIRDRPIAKYKLFKPLKYKNYFIPVIELPAPAKDHHFPDGLEHAEFVVKEPLTKFIQKHKHLNFSTKSLDRPINPELTLKFKDCAVKFHPLSILAVIELEKQRHKPPN